MPRGSSVALIMPSTGHVQTQTAATATTRRQRKTSRDSADRQQRGKRETPTIFSRQPRAANVDHDIAMPTVGSSLFRAPAGYQLSAAVLCSFSTASQNIIFRYACQASCKTGAVRHYIPLMPRAVSQCSRCTEYHQSYNE